MHTITKENIHSILQEHGFHAQPIVHHTNPWKITALFGFITVFSLMILMLSWTFGILSFALLCRAVYKETKKQSSWLSSFLKKEPGTNYVFYSLPVQMPKDIHTQFFYWNQYSSPRSIWKNGPIIYIALGLIAATAIALGNILLTLSLLAALTISAIACYFTATPPKELNTETIHKALDARKHLNEDAILILLEQGYSEESKEIFLLNHSDLFESIHSETEILSPEE